MDEADAAGGDQDTPAEPAQSARDAGDSCSEDSCAASDARVASDKEAGSSPADAGASEAGSATADAGASASVPLDAERSKWVGRFATRSWVFSYDLTTEIKTYSSYLTVAEIKPTNDGGLVLEERLCRFKAEANFLGPGIHEIAYPAGTSLSVPLMYSADRFNALPGSAKVGYGAAPADCAGNATSSSSARPWLVGNVCSCPTDLSVMPTEARDCRVSDPDRDDKPGATYEATWETDHVQKTVFNLVQEVKLRLVNGSRKDERLFAQREYADMTKVFSCVTDGQPKTLLECPIGIKGPCPAEFNPVELVPLTAQLDCDAVLRQEGTLFMMSRPPFPAACTAAVR